MKEKISDMQKLKDLRYYLLIYVILFLILVVQAYTKPRPSLKKISEHPREELIESTANLRFNQTSARTILE